MPYIQLSSCNEGQEDLSLQCVGIGKGDLLSLFQKNLDFIYSLCDCTPGTVPQPCDIGLPVSVHNEQGQQFQIVLRQFAEPPVQQFILQGGQPAKPPGIHIAGIPGAGQGFKFSEQAGLITLVLTLFAGKGLYAVLKKGRQKQGADDCCIICALNVSVILLFKPLPHKGRDRSKGTFTHRRPP